MLQPLALSLSLVFAAAPPSGGGEPAAATAKPHPDASLQKALRVSNRCDTDEHARQTCQISYQGTVFQTVKTLGGPAVAQPRVALVALGKDHKVSLSGSCFLLQTKEGVVGITQKMEVAAFGQESGRMCHADDAR